MKTKEKVYLWVAITLVIFSFCAPILFTKIPWCVVDFSNTGQVGDTIGGIMNPFIAIAGVIGTFLAFYLQVQANKEQRIQFMKSMEEDRIQEELKCRNALQLMQYDIETILNSVRKKCDLIGDYCARKNQNPYAEVACERTTDSHMNRYQTIDRNALYQGFSLFVNTQNKYDDFGNIYNLLDFYYNSVREIFDKTYEPYTTEIQSLKEKLSNLFGELLNGLNSATLISLNPLNNEKLSKIRENGILHIDLLAEELKAQNGLFSIEKNLPIAGMLKEKKKMMLGVVQKMETTQNLLNVELKKFVESAKSPKVMGKLEQINDVLKESLEQNTEDQIRERHNKKIEKLISQD